MLFNLSFRDAMIVALVNCGTSVFAGFVIYSILGFREHKGAGKVADVSILLTKTTVAQNEVALSYHQVHGLYIRAVVFAATL